MADLYEQFFIDMINQGLKAESKSLTAEEEQILLTPVFEFNEGDHPPEMLKRIQNKCMGALTLAYRRDTAGKNREAVIIWRDANQLLYDYSKLFISAVVQEWYLSQGRSMEKKAVGCLSLILTISGFIVLLLAIIIMI